MKPFRHLALLIGIVALFSRTSSAAPAPFQPDRDEVWQFAASVPATPGRQAVLWVPPDCRRVRGVVIALQNMLEKPLFERPAFRRACAANDLALVLVYPGRDSANPLDIFLSPSGPKGPELPVEAGAILQQALTDLAAVSGYSEIQYAPLIPVGHSSAGSFVWHLYRWDASRIAAMVPFKTGIKSDGPQGIPIFNLESEWFDYGKASKNVSSKPSDIANQLRARANGDASLFGFCLDVGAGHCNVSDDSIAPLAMFLKKVVATRIPANAPVDHPVALKPITPESGWLVDIRTFGRPETKAYAYADFPGNPKQAFWYLDRELAEAVQKHVALQLAKKPQQLNFTGKDGVAPTTGGTFNFSPEFIDDQGTFKLNASFIDRLTETDLFGPDDRLTHAAGPILYRVNSGAVTQVGPDTFRILPHFGPVVPQGNPWEPTIIAYHNGDAAYRPTERPAHANVRITLTEGAEQQITFPAVTNQRAGQLASIQLRATSSSGLPVQYFLIAGPARIEGDKLVFDRLPARARFPIKVTVAAWQWGRPVNPKIRTADTVIQEFLIQK